MKTMTVDEAFGDWRKLASDARQQPLKIIGTQQETMIVMSEAEFQRMRGAAWDRLFSSMDRLAAEAKASGLTEEELDRLLADES